MGATTLLNIPYPEPDDAPDGAGQLQALAERVNMLLSGAYIQAATVTVDLGTADAATRRVDFPAPYRQGQPVVVLTQHNDDRKYLHLIRTMTVDLNGFTIDVKVNDNAPNPATFSYVAFGGT